MSCCPREGTRERLGASRPRPNGYLSELELPLAISEAGLSADELWAGSLFRLFVGGYQPALANLRCRTRSSPLRLRTTPCPRARVNGRAICPTDNSQGDCPVLARPGRHTCRRP